MRASNRCPKCRSQRIVSYDRIGAGAYPLLVGGSGGGTFQIGPQVSGPTFRAFVCADCRFVELYFL